MAAWTARWRGQREALARHPVWQAELGPASAALAAIADIVDGKSTAAPLPLAGPFGEYLLPVAYAVRGGRGRR